MEHLRTLDGGEMSDGKRSRENDEEDVWPKKKKKSVIEFASELDFNGKGWTLLGGQNQKLGQNQEN